ncbi:MAG: hypothetical protein Q4P07_01145 [Ornithinimicrobium sp.]|nr:hypothetical protein [Ornithinimicrobium sp.]MDO5738736.1 hypothetical protein [Ornithinimicrobium sp.]
MSRPGPTFRISTSSCAPLSAYSNGRPELPSTMLAVGVGLTPGLHVPALE